VTGLARGVSITLLMVACTGPAAASVLGLNSDGRLVELAIEPGPAHFPAGALPRDEAVAAAAARLGDPATAQRPNEARLVYLTVRTAEGGATVLARRMIWLVRFGDVEFTATLCNCAHRAATAVVVDALDGSALASYGVDG
jgi:hypothetical protein